MEKLNELAQIIEAINDAAAMLEDEQLSIKQARNLILKNSYQLAEKAQALRMRLAR